MVIDDVIVLFPPQIREALRGFAGEHAIDWFLALAGARRLDHTVEPLERIATRLQRQGEIADRGCAAMRSLDARLDNLRAQLEAVKDQMAVLDLELRAVETSVRKLSVREAGIDSQELEEPNWSLDSIQLTREKLAALSTGQREVRQLVQAQADGLAEALTQDGYAASVRPGVTGDQLCQHHCPVAHVASEFPQLCEAETEVFARLLGRHVQRLATIAHGDGVCTTHVPDPEAARASRTSTPHDTGNEERTRPI